MVSNFRSLQRSVLPQVSSAFLRHIFEEVRGVNLPAQEMEDTCVRSLTSQKKYFQSRHSIFGSRLMHEKLPTDDMRFQDIFGFSRYSHSSIEELFSWWTWKAKSRCFSLKDLLEASSKMTCSIKNMEDLISGQLRLVLLPAPPQWIIEVYWCKPEYGRSKLNIDGRALGNPREANVVADILAKDAATTRRLMKQSDLSISIWNEVSWDAYSLESFCFLDSLFIVVCWFPADGRAEGARDTRKGVSRQGSPSKKRTRVDFPEAMGAQTVGAIAREAAPLEGVEVGHELSADKVCYVPNWNISVDESVLLPQVARAFDLGAPLLVGKLELNCCQLRWINDDLTRGDGCSVHGVSKGGGGLEERRDKIAKLVQEQKGRRTES
ncbi:hypothetical protein NE237_006608 [Protea cynaroides]|uniref:Uncharacterized protein n=1 Tax=Protea cynaroides TaxID=273540 RepID=A0A9Q0KNH4_9MAGN|nr:hypothetical protein NE237_006608 [Protea cynaroides]